MVQYIVTGMSCAACSSRVEKAVSSVPGVASCSVSLLTNSMGVEGTASWAEVITAVEQAGYHAALKGADSKSHKSSSKDEKSTEVVKTQPENISAKDDKNVSEKQEVFTYQLGFYSSKENAQNLVNRCKEKNISAQIQQVTRPSGNVYFAVIVKSTDSEIALAQARLHRALVRKSVASYK